MRLPEQPLRGKIAAFEPGRSHRPTAAILAAALAAGVPTGNAMEAQTLYSVQALGGQYFYKGERGALSGNISGLAAPIMILGDSWTLLPSLSGRYQGTKQVVDLVGGGTLFSQQMDHRAGVRGLYRRPGSQWTIKPAVSYSLQLLKETRDEAWFDGLFDYRMLALGVEAEYVYREEHSLRVGFDYVFTHFPNYTSLESRTAFDFQGQSLARELVGDQVLDTRAALLTAAFTAPMGRRARLESELGFTIQTFGRQPIVDGRGQLTDKTRDDLISRIETAVSVPWEAGLDVRAVGRLGVAVSNSVSDQNNYDAFRLKYQAGYYNYTEVKTGPELRLDLGDMRQPVSMALGASLSLRRYPHRETQDASGAYLDETLRQNTWMLTATASYPMTPDFRLMCNFQHGRASSNQGYEQFYSYNYSATNYLIGFRYER